VAVKRDVVFQRDTDGAADAWCVLAHRRSLARPDGYLTVAAIRVKRDTGAHLCQSIVLLVVLMARQFPHEYPLYVRRTKRLVPFVF
jgi:hypothetical protein